MKSLVFFAFALALGAPGVAFPQSAPVASLENELGALTDLLEANARQPNRAKLEEVVTRGRAGLVGAARLERDEEKRPLLAGFHSVVGDALGNLARFRLGSREWNTLSPSEQQELDEIFSAAISHYEAQVPLLGEIEAAEALNRIGVIEHSRRNYVAAANYHRRALGLYYRNPNQGSASASLILNNLAITEMRLNQFSTSMRWLEQIQQGWAQIFDPYRLSHRVPSHLARGQRRQNGKQAELDYYRSLRRHLYYHAVGRPDLLATSLLGGGSQWNSDDKIYLVGLLAEGVVGFLTASHSNDVVEEDAEPLRQKLRQLRDDSVVGEGVRELEKLVAGSTNPDDYPWWRSVDSRLSPTAEHIPRWKMPSRSFQVACLEAMEAANERLRATRSAGDNREATRRALSLALSLYRDNLDPRLVRAWLVTFRREDRQVIERFVSELDSKTDWSSNPANWARLEAFKTLDQVNMALERHGTEEQQYRYGQRLHEMWSSRIRNMKYASWDEDRSVAAYAWSHGRLLGKLMRKLESPRAAHEFELGVAEALVEEGRWFEVERFLAGSEEPIQRRGYDSDYPSFPPLREEEIAETLGAAGVARLRSLRSHLAQGGQEAPGTERVSPRFVALSLEIPAPRYAGLQAKVLAPASGLALDAEDGNQIRDALATMIRDHQGHVDGLRSSQAFSYHDKQRFLPMSQWPSRILGIGLAGSYSQGTVWLEKGGVTHQVLFQLVGSEAFRTEWRHGDLQMIRL